VYIFVVAQSGGARRNSAPAHDSTNSDAAQAFAQVKNRAQLPLALDLWTAISRLWIGGGLNDNRRVVTVAPERLLPLGGRFRFAHPLQWSGGP
jgi:hypothetical protein